MKFKSQMFHPNSERATRAAELFYARGARTSVQQRPRGPCGGGEEGLSPGSSKALQCSQSSRSARQEFSGAVARAWGLWPSGGGSPSPGAHAPDLRCPPGARSLRGRRHLLRHPAESVEPHLRRVGHPHVDPGAERAGRSRICAAAHRARVAAGSHGLARAVGAMRAELAGGPQPQLTSQLRSSPALQREQVRTGARGLRKSWGATGVGACHSLTNGFGVHDCTLVVAGGSTTGACARWWRPAGWRAMRSDSAGRSPPSPPSPAAHGPSALIPRPPAADAEISCPAPIDFFLPRPARSMGRTALSPLYHPCALNPDLCTGAAANGERAARQGGRVRSLRHMVSCGGGGLVGGSTGCPAQRGARRALHTSSGRGV